jgi:hypothetical protein
VPIEPAITGANREATAPLGVQASAVSIESALREQLGLEWRSIPGNVEVLTIERAVTVISAG